MDFFKILLAGALLSQLLLYVSVLLIPLPAKKYKHMKQEKGHPQFDGSQHEPTFEYEQFRRRIKKNVIDFWHLFSSELEDIQRSVATFHPEMAIRISTLVQVGREYQRALRSDLEGLRMADGYSTWREREAAELSDLVQNLLIHLQNPKDCQSARKAVIRSLDNGYGCDLHVLVHRFLIAYSTHRTLIIDSEDWCLNSGWDVIFHPLSDTCTDINGTSPADWFEENTAQVVFLPSSPTLPTAPFFPRTSPTDLAPRLKKLHGNPFSWWVGQFLKYILRPRNNMVEMVEEIAERRGLKRPYVGVHIERFDKNVEENYIPMEKYMVEVEEYYQVLQLSQEVPVRRIYLATDDPEVVSQVKAKYENRYEIFNDIVVANSTPSNETLFNRTSFMEISFDVFFLSLSDYLVCTFSSKTCRLAYEMMQVFHPDASDKAFSLDKQYFYDDELFGSSVAVYPHRPHNVGEINFNVGDEIKEVIDLMNGYSSGVNARTKSSGWFPSFKVVKMMKTYDFPTYPDGTENEKGKN